VVDFFPVHRSNGDKTGGGPWRARWPIAVLHSPLVICLRDGSLKKSNGGMRNLSHKTSLLGVSISISISITAAALLVLSGALLPTPTFASGFQQEKPKSCNRRRAVEPAKKDDGKVPTEKDLKVSRNRRRQSLLRRSLLLPRHQSNSQSSPTVDAQTARYRAGGYAGSWNHWSGNGTGRPPETISALDQKTSRHKTCSASTLNCPRRQFSSGALQSVRDWV
jgi:hypothetical protein